MHIVEQDAPKARPGPSLLTGPATAQQSELQMESGTHRSCTSHQELGEHVAKHTSAVDRLTVELQQGRVGLSLVSHIAGQ